MASFKNSDKDKKNLLEGESSKPVKKSKTKDINLVARTKTDKLKKEKKEKKNTLKTVQENEEEESQ